MSHQVIYSFQGKLEKKKRGPGDQQVSANQAIDKLIAALIELMS